MRPTVEADRAVVDDRQEYGHIEKVRDPTQWGARVLAIVSGQLPGTGAVDLELPVENMSGVRPRPGLRLA